jgi:dienelactone hydrolase
MHSFLLACFTRLPTRCIATVVAAASLAVVTTTAAFANNSTPLPGTDPTVNEQVVMLPVVEKGKSLQFETTLYKPPGEGPFPLLVMNHGKDRGSPADQHRDRFLALAREFVKRGYAVAVPMRKGFSRSTGTYTDFGCNMKDNGQQQADDVQAVLDALVRLPYVDRDRLLIAGQSYGGLATLAFGTRHYPGVRGLINFAGGLRIDGGSCDWKSALIKAAGSYGAKSTLPGLWFYGENDSYFNHALAQQMQAAYQAGGGAAQLVAYGSFKRDAHGMVGSRDGVPIWLPETERFLNSIGMPADEVVAIADTPRPSPTGYALVTSVDAVPNLSVQGKDGYREYLSKGAPRAFAISGSGAWSWAEEGDDPSERALKACQKNSRVPCLLYSVDNDVVWSDPRLSTVPPVSTLPSSTPPLSSQ